MIEAREKALMEKNSHMFKLADHNSPTYDSAPNPNASEGWIWGMKKLFDALQCPRDEAGFYLKDEADIRWATMRNRQYEP